ncbi:sn-glycerol-3-phosphate import ATP-binding protein UgpC [Nymphon striatum]|nr:sn-glycerol-3-phosphate import ATP-binding protein UgpC [Nymphon striatum]
MLATITEAAKISDIVLPSFDDETACFGDATPTETAHRYQELGASMVVVKNGENPTLVLNRGALSDHPVAQTSGVIDTTAAGDSFNGAFLAELLKTNDVAGAVVAAQNCAAQVVCTKGALVPFDQLGATLYRDVAMVFQNYALYPHLNVADNIAFGLRIRKVKKDEIASSVSEVAEILGLSPYLDRRPADLSGGQRQRVAMGRAIVRHPEVFLFDEPLSNLDAKLRTQMRAEIKRLHNRLGVTSVYVTHDQVEAMTLADRIVVMSDGRIEQIGTPMELFNNPVNTFVAGFIGSPPMNQIEATVGAGDTGPIAKIDGVDVILPALKELQNAEGRKIVVGLRPEHVSISPVENGSTLPVQLDLIRNAGF